MRVVLYIIIEKILNNPNPINTIWKEHMSFKHYFFEMKGKLGSIIQIKKSDRIDFCIDSSKIL